MLLAADLGGTALKLALVDGQSRLICRREVSVSFDGYRPPLIVTTERAIRALLQETGATIAGIAVSATGQIDAAVGTVAGSNGSIPGYEGTPIRGHLERAFRLPVHVLNDAGKDFLSIATPIDSMTLRGCSLRNNRINFINPAKLSDTGITKLTL